VIAYKALLRLTCRKFISKVPVCVFLEADGLGYFWTLVYPCLDVWSTRQSSYVCVLRAFACDEPPLYKVYTCWMFKVFDWSVVLSCHLNETTTYVHHKMQTKYLMCKPRQMNSRNKSVNCTSGRLINNATSWYEKCIF